MPAVIAARWTAPRASVTAALVCQAARLTASATHSTHATLTQGCSTRTAARARIGATSRLSASATPSSVRTQAQPHAQEASWRRRALRSANGHPAIPSCPRRCSRRDPPGTRRPPRRSAPAAPRAADPVSSVSSASGEVHVSLQKCASASAADEQTRRCATTSRQPRRSEPSTSVASRAPGRSPGGGAQLAADASRNSAPAAEGNAATRSAAGDRRGSRRRARVATPARSERQPNLKQRAMVVTQPRTPARSSSHGQPDVAAGERAAAPADESERREPPCHAGECGSSCAGCTLVE